MTRALEKLGLKMVDARADAFIIAVGQFCSIYSLLAWMVEGEEWGGLVTLFILAIYMGLEIVRNIAEYQLFKITMRRPYLHLQGAYIKLMLANHAMYLRNSRNVRATT